MDTFFDKLLVKIYGDSEKKGCPMFPLFGISGSLAAIMIGYCSLMTANSGWMTGHWHIIGFLVGVLGLLLNLTFLIILFVSENRYCRQRVKVHAGTDDTDAGSSSTAEPPARQPMNEASLNPLPPQQYINPESMYNGHIGNHTGESSPSDSFLGLYEDPPDSLDSFNGNPSIPLSLQAPDFSATPEITSSSDTEEISNTSPEPSSIPPSR